MPAGLAARGCGWQAVLYVHLLLRHMPHFPAANAAYRGIVPQASAPARACVAAPLPAGVLCAIDALVAAPPARTPSAASMGDPLDGHPEASGRSRKVLHVQSHSEWAPASIGPYSQAAVWNGLLFMAGQIPLDPASMEVRSPVFRVNPTTM